MNATRFLQHVSQDKALEAQLALTGWETDAVLALAASHGFSFGANELQAAIDQVWGVFSEEELRNAVGGKGDHDDHDHDGDKDNGGGHASTCSFYYGG